jgi:hypothetical protein
MSSVQHIVLLSLKDPSDAQEAGKRFLALKTECKRDGQPFITVRFPRS